MMKDTSKNLYKYATGYAGLGWSVLPMQPGKKVPYIKWKPYQNKRAAPDEIKSWFQRWPDAQIGVVTGSVSNLVVIDFDSFEALDRFKSTVCDLPETIRQKTGREKGGIHYLFKYTNNGTEIRSKSGILPDVDVRGQAGLIVVAPSLHKSGNRYRWEHIDPLEFGLDDLLDLPEEFIAFYCSRTTSTSNTKAIDLVEAIENGVGEGQRNDMCAKVAGYLLRENHGNYDKTLCALLEWNQRNSPPMPKDEVKKVAISIHKAEIAKTKTGTNSAAKLRINAGIQDLSYQSGQAWKALKIANSNPYLFRYPDGIVRIEKNSENIVQPRVLQQDHLMYEIVRAADWYKKKAKEESSAIPQACVVKDMLADPQPPLPSLARIIHAPVFAADRSLHTTEGYSKTSRCYLTTNGISGDLNVPDKPTADDLKEAWEVIEDLICDFPFVGDAEKAHAIALLLLPFARSMIDGPTPLHLIEAPKPGTGKTTLVETLTYPFMGSPVGCMSEGGGDEEWRKRITAKLIGSPAYLLIDNVRNKLDSGALSSAITATVWEDRILRKSQIVRVPVPCGWIVTSNDPKLSSEMARRAISIRMDAKMDRPWLRDTSDFKHPNIAAHCRKNRGQIVRSVLIVIKKWIADDCPVVKDAISLGKFESWSRTIGGILYANDVHGFLENLNELYEKSDPQDEPFREFVAVWWAEYGEKLVGVADLYKLIIANNLSIPVGDEEEHSRKIQLGNILASLNGRRFGEHTITLGKKYQGALQWKLTTSSAKVVNISDKQKYMFRKAE